jgi:hypothetical protein
MESKIGFAGTWGLFDPSLYSQSESDNSILSEVSSVVSSYLSSCGLGDISVVSQELVGFISYASVQVSRSPKLFSSVKDLVQLAVRSSTTYPAVSVAAECLLVSPVSTVDCEREALTSSYNDSWHSI